MVFSKQILKDISLSDSISLLAGGSTYLFYEFSKPRTLGHSHISILHGQ